jgi:hypothetical protein
MSTTATCPHCHGKLRLRQSGAPRVRCRLCGKGFDNPLATVVPIEVLTRPLGGPAAPAPAVAHTDLRNPTAELGPPRPDVGAAPGRFVPDPILTVPRQPGAGRAAAARRRLRARRAARARLRDHALAAAVVLAVIGAVVGGWYVALTGDRTEPRGNEPPAVARDDGDEATEPTPEPVLPTDSPASAKPLPARLVGVWELRADEDRTGTMEFRANGTVRFEAVVGGQEVPSTHYRAFLVAEEGDALTLELGEAADAPGKFRLRLVFTGPDALTTIGVMNLGIESNEDQRFVRRTAARIELPPHPAMP